MTRPPQDPPRPSTRLPTPSVSSPPLEIQVSYRYGAPLIYVSGELDHGTANQLRGSIDEELAGQPSALLLEFSRLAYVDSGGLSLLFETAQRIKEGGWLGIVSPSGNVRKLIDMTGISERKGFRVIENLADVPAAIAELPD